MHKLNASNHFQKLYESLEKKRRNEQELIKRFVLAYKQHGMPDEDYSVFPGKLSESWAGLDLTSSLYVHAKENHLHHYHIGYTTYWSTKKKYKTSEWVIHFIWHKSDRSKWNEIKIVDYTPHKLNGEFPLPSKEKLI